MEKTKTSIKGNDERERKTSGRLLNHQSCCSKLRFGTFKNPKSSRGKCSNVNRICQKGALSNVYKVHNTYAIGRVEGGNKGPSVAYRQ